MDALILAGGKGTRLRSVVSDRPKVMADVNGRPYLTYLFDQLIQAGIQRVILGTGYMADYIENEFGDQYNNLSIAYSVETEPLGTGGAIRHALTHVQSDNLLVMNGDSYCDVSLKHFIKAHHSLASIVLVHRPNTARYGQVTFDHDANVTQFIEKNGQARPGWINAGIYLMHRDLIENLPADTAISIEKEVFPDWVEQGILKGYFTQGKFIDIGLPESYAEASEFFASQGTKRYVALDRDGTIIKQIHYLSEPEQVEILDGAVDGMRRMRESGLGLIVVTNQSAIGRGYFDEAQLAKVHDRMNALLANEGLAVDGIYFCPATPDDNDPNRKPEIGMMLEAQQDFGFDLTQCVVVGDKTSDTQLGKNIGCLSILVRTGYGAEHEHKQPAYHDHVADNLRDASQIIADYLSS